MRRLQDEGLHGERADPRGVLHAAARARRDGRAFSSLGRRLDPITQDSCAFFDDHDVFDDFTGVVNETSEGDRIAGALGKHKAAILQNHGLLTVGTSVDAAVWWFITMERTCEVQLAAMAAGTPKVISPEIAALTYEQIGNDVVGMFQFHPLWTWITAQEPDLLD